MTRNDPTASSAQQLLEDTANDIQRWLDQVITDHSTNGDRSVALHDILNSQLRLLPSDDLASQAFLFGIVLGRRMDPGCDLSSDARTTIARLVQRVAGHFSASIEGAMSKCQTSADASDRVMHARTGCFVNASLDYLGELQRMVNNWQAEIQTETQKHIQKQMDTLKRAAEGRVGDGSDTEEILAALPPSTRTVFRVLAAQPHVRMNAQNISSKAALHRDLVEISLDELHSACMVERHNRGPFPGDPLWSAVLA
jgi:hypothetical protein